MRKGWNIFITNIALAAFFSLGSNCTADTCTPCFNSTPTNYPCNCFGYGWDVYFTASYVYFQPFQENLDYIEINRQKALENSNSQDIEWQRDEGKLSFDWNSAFKIGLEFNIGCDNWVFDLEYFRYHSKSAHGSLSLETKESECTPPNSVSACGFWARGLADNVYGYDGGGVPDTLFFFNPKSLTSEARWDLNIDIADFSFSKRYLIEKCLIFQPHFGVRAAWIDQKYVVNYEACVQIPYEYDSQVQASTIETKSINKSDSWGVGLRAGLDIEWDLGCNYFLFENSGFSILYTEYERIKQEQEFTQTDEENGYSSILFTTNASSEGKNSKCFLRPQANLGVGLGWRDNYCQNPCNNWYLELKVSYELQAYWRQNVLYAVNDCKQHPSRLFGDLFLHGAIVTAKVSF